MSVSIRCLTRVYFGEIPYIISFLNQGLNIGVDTFYIVVPSRERFDRVENILGEYSGVCEVIFEEQGRNPNHALRIDVCLVDDLRTVTLADGGRLHLLIAPSSISEEASLVIETMRHALEEAGFEIILELADVTADADAMRIRQALLALLTNALHHAKPGPLVVRASSDGLFARLAVEDSGPGLPPEFERRAFDPFTRAAPLKAKSRSGSGLGLSVVRAIAMAHGGQLRYLRSSRGGSMFEMAIPLDRPQSLAAPLDEQLS